MGTFETTECTKSQTKQSILRLITARHTSKQRPIGLVGEETFFFPPSHALRRTRASTHTFVANPPWSLAYAYRAKLSPVPSVLSHAPGCFKITWADKEQVMHVAVISFGRMTCDMVGQQTALGKWMCPITIANCWL